MIRSGPCLLCGIDVGGSNDFIHFFPIGANKAAQTAHFLIRFAGLLRYLTIDCPCIHGVFGDFLGIAVGFQQAAAHQRVFQAVGAVEIPGIACATRATTRLVVGHIWAGARVIRLLRFPCHKTVFDINLPAAGASAIHAMGGAHNFVVLPAATISLFPAAKVSVIFLKKFSRSRK
jgi:hypothetical protein